MTTLLFQNIPHRKKNLFLEDSVEIRVKNIFRKLHTLSAKQRLTAGPAKLHSQIFYIYGSRIY